MAPEMGRPGVAFEPEEFAGGIEFEKDVSPVRRQDDVDGAVVQGEVIQESKEFFFDLERQLVRLAVLKPANAVAAPVVSGACGDL